jgi:2-keto-4-pentenoate hydratase
VNRDDERVVEGMRRLGQRRDALSGETARLGWKAGFGTEPAMAAIGTEQPLIGFLTTATRLDSGASVDVSDWGGPLLEAEVAVRVDSELGRGTSAEEARAAIGAVAAAIELVDVEAVEGIEQLLGGNIFHRQVLLGDFTELGEVELDEIRLSLTADGEDSGPVDPSTLLGDLGSVVAALADQADLIGDRIRPGDVVITGAAVPPAQLNSGDTYHVRISGPSSAVSVEID